jgi:hypothetical protein
MQDGKQLRHRPSWSYLIICAVIILLVVIIAYGLGFTTPSSGQPPQICQLEAGFSCSNFYMTSNGLLTIGIVQATTSPLNITAIGCNTNSKNIQTQEVTPHAYLPIGANRTFSMQCYAGSKPLSGSIYQIYTGYLKINYTDFPNESLHTLYGMAEVKIYK